MSHSYMAISLWLWWICFSLDHDQCTPRIINEYILWPRSVLLWFMNIGITREHLIRKISYSVILGCREVKKHDGSYNLGGLRTKNIGIKTNNLHYFNIVCASLSLHHWIAVRLAEFADVAAVSFFSAANSAFQKRLPFLHGCLYFEKIRKKWLTISILPLNVQWIYWFSEHSFLELHSLFPT